MHKYIFLTETLGQKEFTSGWSYLTDANGQPCFGDIEILDNKIVCTTTEKQISLHILLDVPEFGKVVLQTCLTKKAKMYDLLDELIKGRINQIEDELKDDTTILYEIKKEFEIDKNIKNSLLKLSKLLLIGEKIVMTVAEEKLKKKISQGELKKFLIGGQAFGVQKGEAYKKIHEETFNMGIAPFYFFLLKKDNRETIDWTFTDEIVDWLTQTNRVIKGHPIVWLHKYARPEWMLSLTFEELKIFLQEHITAVVLRYKDRIKMWDIVNEIPAIDANGYDLTIEQLLEITKMTSDLVKKLQPEAERIINFSEIFGANSYIHEKPSIPPVYFLSLCEKYGIEYESIGLQFYMGMKKEFVCRELLNISQSVDGFLQFHKNIHFSELGWPSKHDVDPDCFFSSDHPEVGGRWHRNWDEELQAEFVEKIYTLFASKDNAKSITWWDMTDNGKNEDIGSRFLPFGGLTRRDFSPKPALLKIVEFKKRIYSTSKNAV